MKILNLKYWGSTALVGIDFKIDETPENSCRCITIDFAEFCWPPPLLCPPLSWQTTQLPPPPELCICNPQHCGRSSGTVIIIHMPIFTEMAYHDRQCKLRKPDDNPLLNAAAASLLKTAPPQSARNFVNFLLTTTATIQRLQQTCRPFL